MGSRKRPIAKDAPPVPPPTALVVKSFQFAGASMFRTIRENNPAWQFDGTAGWRDETLAGQFVRIEPPPHATDDDVERVRRWVVECGAIANRVQPRRAPAVLTLVSVVRRDAGGIRGVVASMVQESNSADRAVLLAYAERVMDAVGI